MKKIIYLLIILSICLVSSMGNEIPVQIQVTNASGNIVTGTFNFTINISSSSTCSPILYSNTTEKTTDSRGIVSYNIPVDLTFAEQYWICYYRDDVLKETRKIGVSPYAFRANVSDNLDTTRSYQMANLTVSQKITFALGGVIDNIKSGWLKITGNLEVTGNATLANLSVSGYVVGLDNKTTLACNNITGSSGNLCTNQTNDAKTYADSIFITQANEGNLNVNSTTWWATISGYVSKWFYNSGDELTLNETQLNLSIDLRETNCTDDNSCPLITYDSELTYTVDTSASVNCSDDEVFLGNGSCRSSNAFFDNTDTTYTNGSGISLVGTQFNHSDTSSQASEDNSGNTFIQDIVLDGFGHITSIVNAGVDFSSYVAIANLVGMVGNWSADKGDYSTTAEADALYRANSWDNITGIPHATPSDGDTTHFSLADEIYDWVIGLGYWAGSTINSAIAGNVSGLIGSTNVAWINESNTFTPAQTFSNNITTEGIKLEGNTSHYTYNNGTCMISIVGTTRFELCQ